MHFPHLHKVTSLLFVSIILLFTQHLNGQDMEDISNKSSIDTATFGMGCFWCTEAIFEQLKGVTKVTSGYSGGEVANPTYEMICSGTTAYAEVCQIIFDPQLISYQSLLEVFWGMHDPTTLNRQGADVGTQYRSVIFYHDELQKSTADFFKQELEDAEIWSDPIVTEISAYTRFYPAEKYHQDYYRNNASNSYCNLVITPKVKKFQKIFSDRIR